MLTTSGPGRCMVSARLSGDVGGRTLMDELLIPIFGIVGSFGSIRYLAYV